MIAGSGANAAMIVPTRTAVIKTIIINQPRNTVLYPSMRPLQQTGITF